jgi:hypothetical protein
LTVGERYHDPLRRIYRKLRHDFPNLSESLAHSLANKAMNDTVGPEGLVPTLLVFGRVPRLSIGDVRVLAGLNRERAVRKAYTITEARMAYRMIV